eukprot:4435734-Prymnesium_polylepis.1
MACRAQVGSVAHAQRPASWQTTSSKERRRSTSATICQQASSPATWRAERRAECHQSRVRSLWFNLWAAYKVHREKEGHVRDGDKEDGELQPRALREWGWGRPALWCHRSEWWVETGERTAIFGLPEPSAWPTRALSTWLKASGGTMRMPVTMSESDAAARYSSGE